MAQQFAPVSYLSAMTLTGSGSETSASSSRSSTESRRQLRVLENRGIAGMSQTALLLNQKL